MASFKTAYVAFGVDASIGFAGDDVLNRPSRRAFDDPPWKVFDSDVHFEPMFVEGFAPVSEDDPLTLESTDTEHAENSSKQGLSRQIEDRDTDHRILETDDLEGSEWAEAADSNPEVMGVPEDEVLARIEEAVTAAKTELMSAHEQKVAELENTLTALEDSHQAECVQIKEQTAADLEVQVKKTILQYRNLIQQIQGASNRVSEFFEPLSKLSVHIAEQLVRGELTIGPVAITRLVQGCLDSIEGRLSTEEPVLKMHPSDLEMFLIGFDEKPSGVRFVADDGLARGDVSLQMDHSVIDDLLAKRMEQITQYVFGRLEDRNDMLFDADVNDVRTLDLGVEDVPTGELSKPFAGVLDNNAEINSDYEALKAPTAGDVAMETDSPNNKDLVSAQRPEVGGSRVRDQEKILELDNEAEVDAEVEETVEGHAEGAIKQASDTTATESKTDEQPPLDLDQKSDS